MNEITRCDSCEVDVTNLADHIFNKKHTSIRRLKKSYVKFTHSDHLPRRSQTVFAVKSRPVTEVEDGFRSGQTKLDGSEIGKTDMERSMLEQTEVVGSDLGRNTGTSLISQDEVLVNVRNSTVNLSSQSVMSEFESLSYSDGIELYRSGPETDTESNVDGEEIDLDSCLAVESIEKRQINAEMDKLDKVIEEGRKAAEIRDQNQIGRN